MRPPALHTHALRMRPSIQILESRLGGGLAARSSALPVAISRKTFSIQTTYRSKDKNTNDESINPQLPKVTFESLGIAGPLKWVVVGLLTIFGTIETWVWCKAILRWWKGREQLEVGQTDE